MGVRRFLATPRNALERRSGRRAAARPPIAVLGLARSGTTWVGAALGCAPGVRYIHEPFGPRVPTAAPHAGRYVPASTPDDAFDEYCRSAFVGDVDGPFTDMHRSPLYRAHPDWPGRSVVKDVDMHFGIERIAATLAPEVVIVKRHPCAVAASWARLGIDAHAPLERIRRQPRLIADHLTGCEEPLHGAQDYWQSIGALWGATNRFLAREAAAHPEWITVDHETLCLAPQAGYRALFRRLSLPYGRRAARFVRRSSVRDSADPYDPRRISANEPLKWRRELTPAQVASVQAFAQPFVRTPS